MRRKHLVVALAATVLSLAAPAGGAVASPTVRLAIAHVVSHCHVWRTPTNLLGPSTKVTVKRGTRIVIRSDCPMDFVFVQTRGPRLSLGNPRTYAGASRTLTFRKAGVYRLTATNVQTPDERGLITLGETTNWSIAPMSGSDFNHGSLTRSRHASTKRADPRTRNGRVWKRRAVASTGRVTFAALCSLASSSTAATSASSRAS